MLSLTLLVAVSCGGQAERPSAGAAKCGGAVTSILDIQGQGDRSPLHGAAVVTGGVVTYVDPGQGVYIESAARDDSRSSGLFVSGPELPGTLRVGQQIEVSGTVAELGEGTDTLTALVQVDSHSVCANGRALPETAVTLPLGFEAREALEGMRLSVRQPLVVSDVYSMHRGDWSVSAGGALRIQPTALTAGGPVRRHVPGNAGRFGHRPAAGRAGARQQRQAAIARRRTDRRWDRARTHRAAR